MVELRIQYAKACLEPKLRFAGPAGARLHLYGQRPAAGGTAAAPEVGPVEVALLSC